MMWIRLIGIAFFLAGETDSAQSASESVTRLESCFQAARLADTVCAKQDDPTQRLDCFEKMRARQVECLEYVLPEAPTASENSVGTAPLAPPSNAAEAPSKGVSSKEPGQTEPPGMSTGSIPADKSNSPSKADLKTNPPQIPTTRDLPTASIRSDAPAKSADIPAQPAATNWIVSETTSPIDYSPLVTAVIHSTPVVKNGPNTLTIGCRGHRTELSVGMEGDVGASRNGEPQIDSQINEQPAVRRRWAWSADGKIATYKDDPVELLQSVPEGARLKIAVSDRENVRHEAAFQLAGLGAVLRKVGTACNWAPAQAKTSSEKR
jgi:hypothetical protein